MKLLLPVPRTSRKHVQHPFVLFREDLLRVQGLGLSIQNPNEQLVLFFDFLESCYDESKSSNTTSSGNWIPKTRMLRKTFQYDFQIRTSSKDQEVRLGRLRVAARGVVGKPCQVLEAGDPAVHGSAASATRSRSQCRRFGDCGVYILL